MLKFYFIMLNLRNYSAVFWGDRIYLRAILQDYAEKTAIFCRLKNNGRILQQKGGENENQ